MLEARSIDFETVIIVDASREASCLPKPQVWDHPTDRKGQDLDYPPTSGKIISVPTTSSAS